MAGLVNPQPLLHWQARKQLLIGWGQRLARLADDLRQFSTRDRYPHDIPEELANRRERRVTGPLEVSNQAGQFGTHQSTVRDRRRQRSLVDLLAMRAPSRMTAMLLNRERHFGDVHLLDHPRHDRGCTLEVASAPRTEVEKMIEGPPIEGFGRKRGTFVHRMSRLSAALPLPFTFGRRRLWRLDDVRRRRL